MLAPSRSRDGEAAAKASGRPSSPRSSVRPSQPGTAAGRWKVTWRRQRRSRLLRQSREHELALFALGEQHTRPRVDDRGQEVVLVDVRAGTLLDALARDARADHLGEPEDIRAAEAQAGVDLVPHRLRPG